MTVRLDSQNFTLWKGLKLPAVAGAGLFIYLDGSEVASPKKIKKGEGDAAVEVHNLAYTC
jgi:hypothetical protein